VAAENACFMSSRIPSRFDSCPLARYRSCVQVWLPRYRRVSSVIINLANGSCVVTDLNVEIRKWFVHGRCALFNLVMDIDHRERKFIMCSFVSQGMSKIDSHFNFAVSSAVP